MRKIWIETIKEHMGSFGVNILDDEAIVDKALKKYVEHVDMIHPYFHYEISTQNNLSKGNEEVSYEDILEYNLNANYLEFWT